MKLCYMIMDKIKACPETSVYRMFTEEKIKWIMEKTDQIEDIRKLEEVVGAGEVIEVTIQELHNEYKLIDFALRNLRPKNRRQALGGRPGL
jgi:hypothetical protein